MKRVINGRVYNTDTAERLADVSCGSDYTNDLEFDSSWLYRTKDGRYFIAGEGGPKSRWALSGNPNTISGGSGIVVLTEEEAREALEAANTDEATEALLRYADELGVETDETD